MNDAVLRYVMGVVLCAVVAVAYAATRKRGLRAVLVDSALCFGCMLAVVAAVAAVVHVFCVLR